MPFTNPDQLPGGQNMAAFLDMLGLSEGTTTVAGGDDGYNVNVGGKLFSGYDEHPRIVVLTRWGLSDAAGRYQIMAAVPGKIRTDTWDWTSHACGVTDFSTRSQDIGAAYLIKGRGALPDLMAGLFADALRECRQKWASLPGAGYGQREHRLGWCARSGAMTASKARRAKPRSTSSRGFPSSSTRPTRALTRPGDFQINSERN